MVSQDMVKLGTNRSVIRDLFEYGNKRKAEIGADRVFDFSLGMEMNFYCTVILRRREMPA